ncbi:hypothetical protein MPH_02459 [Macrophomina phaseolina MS6]|uniref:Altered inheritance of mitochondria protein 21 n=1 Tax=Macrophomina phaseolina (strain MS6) TaxID=1126212 RepID=K2RCF2_MACPH|nr:hypothetical protein MPH_02459 [Macrophomina phaseolina MS6]
MAAPSIPQRPARSQQSQNVPTIAGDVPKIPPRPKRSIERSVSPNRDTFARSPLNDPSFVNGSGNASKRLSASDLPARPPSVTLPSIGQEGSEYEGLETPPVDENAPRQTRDAEGLKLHAPTAEMPQSTARSRIAAVTRTDSEQAAAAGFGRAPSHGRGSSHGRAPSQSDTERPTRTSSSTGARSRPQSLYGAEFEHGIPEIGLQVPMYPNAGDVQAPTPSNNSSMPATGVGFFNSGGQRNHTRTKSGREVFHGPPGSYGLHGHGVKPQDNFEKQWYAKHPEDAAREAQGEYGPAIQDNRKEWALSSEELNRLVRDSAAHGVGMGASPGAIGTPAEEIGYIATEEYASRMASPRPTSKAPKERKSSSQTHAESPLRKSSDPSNVIDKDTSAIEPDEDDVIHIDPPTNARSHIHGGGPEAENFSAGGADEDHDGFVTEDGRGTPILASDELERHKTPGAEHMQPAVPAELERERRLSQEADYAHRRSSSRPTSRPTSGMGLSRWKSGEEDRNGTPLDNVQEYEPLFPEDDDEKKPAEKPITAADKLKRPDLARHHFPSQDVWEDTPSSLQLQTEVETPEIPDEPQSDTASLQSSQIFEKPEAEDKRKAEVTPKEEDNKSFLADHQKRPSKSHFNKDVLGDMPSRPGMQQRFPSQDIWEDTPSELQLVTEVQAPQTDDTESPVEPKSTVEERPQVPPRPNIPSRPAGRSKLGESQGASPVDKKAPTIPERPKPQIPVRPARPGHKASDEQVPLSKVTSGGSTGSEEASAAGTKPKPPVPSRPGGGKIAALKAGFLNDLNSRLQLGPQAPKRKEEEREKEEEQKEKAPLADARKGRAKGPARRKPAASPSAAAAAAPAEKKTDQVLSLGTIQTVFSISDDGDVEVPSSKPAAEKKSEPVDAKTSDPAEEEKSDPIEEKPTAAEASVATQVPPNPKPAPSDSPAAEKELEPEIPKAGETDATRVVPDLSAETNVEEETKLAPTQSKTSDSAAQTGQQDVEIPKVGGGTEKLTAYIGGRAPEEGSVVVKDGEETVGDADGKHGIEQTGSGM